MARADVEMDMVEACGSFTVHVRVRRVRELRVRMWLGRQCLRLGAWIMNMGVAFDEEAA